MITAASILKLGAPAAQKAGSLIFQKISRLRRINEALDGVESDDIAATAISDFEIVKGTWKGEFTETVDKFLRAFEASGLSKVMFNNALVHGRSPAIQSAFVSLFQAETEQDEQNGALLYNQIATSFEITSQQLTRDPLLARMIRSSHQSLLDSVVAVESSLETIRAGLLGRPSSEEMLEVIPRILRAVAGDTKHIRVETSQGRKDVEINKIYIPPRLSVRDIDQVRPTVKSLTDALVERDRTANPFSDHDSETRTRIENAISCVTFDEIQEIHKVVILGNPGGGKSTLLQSVCYKFSAESLRKLSDGSSFSEIKIPIRIILRDYEHARLVSPQLSLIEYIVNDLLHAVYADKRVLGACLENLLSAGQIYLAFDGLDEILKTANRRQFVDIVNRFVRQYPLCQVLVTSREVGYDNAPLPSAEYEELILGEFADADVRLYADRFIRHVGKKKAADARQAAQQFMNQTTRNAEDLRRNPLMLGLMMWIFNIRDDVPSNRPEIYQECARLMFERWDGERGIIVQLPQTFDRLQVFSYLASRIFDDAELSSGVSARWIERETRSHLCEVLESAPQAQAAAASLVQFIVDRSWVMSEKGEGVFSFTHQTFLEYFFAKHNDDQHDTVAGLFNFLLPHIQQDEWDVVSRLSLQIKTHRNRRRQDEAIDELIRALQDSNVGDHERRALSGFAIRSLEFLVGSEANIRSLVYEILSAMRSCYRAGLTEVMDAVPLLFSGARERRVFIAEAIETWFCESFIDGLEEDRDFVLACVDGVVGKFGHFGHQCAPCRSIPGEFVKRYRGGLLPTLIGEAQSNPKSVKTLFEWTGTLPKVALNNFGPAFIHFARPPARINIDGLSALALAASGLYPNIFQSGGWGEATPFTKSKAETSLATFGAYWRRTGLKGLVPFDLAPDLNNPPIVIWAEMLRAVRADPNLRLGACVACFLECQNHGVGGDGDEGAHDLIKEVTRQARLLERSGDTEAGEMVALLAADMAIRLSRPGELEVEASPGGVD